MLFASFFRRNRAFFKLAVLSNLEYRLNFITDSLIQPAISSCIELCLWFAVFQTRADGTLNGFPLKNYLAYAIWAAFVARLTSTWTYEFRMIEEIDSGSINSLLVRPISFFEYYLSQFLGYKFIVSAFSLFFPVLLCLILDLPFSWSRLFGAALLGIYYLFLSQTMSFLVASTAFHFNRNHSFTAAKNLGLWLLSGELVPIDLFPESIRRFLLYLPFPSAVYLPVGYLTGRIPFEVFAQGFVTVTEGLLVFGALAYGMWRWGLGRYAGTGA